MSEANDTCKHKGPHCTCDLGIDVRKLVGGVDFGWAVRIPCTQDGSFKRVKCDSFQLPTDAEHAEGERQWAEVLEQAHKEIELTAPLCEQLRMLHKGKDATGIAPCPVCSKELQWSHAGYNGHVWMRCSTEDCVNFME